LPEVDRRTAKHLVLLLEQAVALLQVSDLGLLNEGQPLPLAVFDLGPLDPASQTRLRDAECQRRLKTDPLATVNRAGFTGGSGL
jgi:hypothetical protein